MCESPAATFGSVVVVGVGVPVVPVTETVFVIVVLLPSASRLSE